ncbi:hypothetical protein GE21DRAFT_6573 [Neurospora crassa]|uniref:Uncharacterized protein n=1 Tax=Neurospora crassa (strain ATCC 24698 / 74-OR23-1A / CBS 708.71 / DSM 1257 / FGSC 987) TaxID=367110 RepID=Q7S8F4_NEUCR|nr:hypothetical protein NCU08816 [Neurospora crassa OR74A]EAA32620.2 hypothetical protein NCU08816 [Neurospora crassa OR74A]KHE78788.1 hypothetical protein GE21DRAFT_6573 [Neurospora crassa]|eukprot:XP_961856.2 hypothetical protein NCU08816 [Neurospora crassa OR74A]
MSTALSILQDALAKELDSLSDPEDWSEFGLMDVEEDTSTPEEVSALREFVQAYNTPNALDAEETARKLMSLNEDRVPCDGDFDKGWRISWLLYEVGIQMAQYQVAILVVADAIMALPRLDATPEQEVRFGKEKLERWRKLEVFWYDCWSERWDRYNAFRYSTASGAYICANAWVARHLVLHPPDIYYTSELSLAFSRMMLALEKDQWNYPYVREDGDATFRSPKDWTITMLNTDVHALVPFLVIAGDIMYRYTDREMIARRFAEAGQENHVHNTREFWQRFSTNRSERSLWKAEKKVDQHEWLTRERWAFWKKRLVWISEQTELLQRTRDEAIMLVQLMTEIEGRGA